LRGEKTWLATRKKREGGEVLLARTINRFKRPNNPLHRERWPAISGVEGLNWKVILNFRGKKKGAREKGEGKTEGRSIQTPMWQKKKRVPAHPRAKPRGKGGCEERNVNSSQGGKNLPQHIKEEKKNFQKKKEKGTARWAREKERDGRTPPQGRKDDATER